MEKKTFGRTIRKITSVIIVTAMLLSALPVFGLGFDSGYDLPWLWPVPGSFNINCLDYYYTGSLHNYGQCMDIGSNGYTGANRLDVVSATSGTVLSIVNKYDEENNRGSGWGNYVVVKCANMYVVYGHLQSISCTYGPINAGDVIGKMGNTGNSTGVHLHLQAYPVTGNYTSTDICVFDQFKDNPLYYPKFRFMKGLATYSVKYADWIKTYYKNVSGSYYTYSGGLVSDYDLTYVDAKVKVIASSGAALRTTPLADNAYITDTTEFNKIIDIVGYITDSYGKVWLKAENGSWIQAEDVGFYDYNSSLALYDEITPDSPIGAVCELMLGGSLNSGNPITSVTANIFDSGKNAVIRKTVNTNSLSVNVAEVFENVFADESLKDGKYTFSLSVTTKATYPGQAEYSSSEELYEFAFSINTDLSDNVFPIVESVTVTDINDDYADISVVASDETLLAKVTIYAVSDKDDMTTLAYTCEKSEGGTYDTRIIFSDFTKGANKITVTAAAADSHGNETKLTREIAIPRPGSEIWVANFDSIRHRTSPGTSGTKIKSVNKGTECTFVGITTVGSDVWAKTDEGNYTALYYGNSSYYTYVSGSMFTIVLDGNGNGKAETIGKRYGKDCVLPSEAPVRAGYTFLGWGASSDATKVLYKAGDTITANENLCLFAIWQDKTAPEIKSVTADITAWTNESVVITVKADDATGTVFFSFDKGATWLPEGELTVKENTVFPKGSIMVRDVSGNTSTYGSDFKVTNIDKTAPSLESATADVSVSGTSVTFKLEGITDSESGIQKYDIILSSTSDFASTTSKEIKSGTPVTIPEGVWYWRLKATDKAGNFSVKQFNRFRVGAAQKLSAPLGFAKVMTGSTFGDFAWSASENADKYTVMVSSSSDFKDAVTYETTETTITVGNLSAGQTYYAKICADCSDGVFLPSDYGPTVSFATLSDDAVLYGFEKLTDAVISEDSHECLYFAAYNDTKLDLTAKINPLSKAEYFGDPELTSEIKGITQYSLSGNTATVYIVVTAENGSSSLYTLTIRRAPESAGTPVLSVDDEDFVPSITIGEKTGEIKLDAEVNDGGTLKTEWFVTFGGVTEKAGEGSTFSFTPEKAGDYSIFATVTNTNVKCKYQTAEKSTEPFVLTVEKHESEINISVSDYEYNGKAPNVITEDYTGDGNVSVCFYSDETCLSKIDPPVNAGTYYVRAEADETDSYQKSVSEIVTFRITKAKASAELAFTKKGPTLRDGKTYVTVTSENSEYSLNGSAWAPASSITLNPEDVLKLRIAGDINHFEGETTTITAEKYSGSTSIQPADDSNFTREGDYIYVSNFGTISGELLRDSLINDTGISLLDKDGKALGDSAAVTTGAVIVFSDELGEIERVTVIVLGDVDCDGKVTSSDAYLAMKISNGMAKCENEIEKLAADWNGDGKITSADAYLIKITAAA